MCQKGRKSPWAGMTQGRNHPGRVITPATSTAAGKQITYTDLQTDKLAKAPIGWRHTPYLPAMLKTSRVESGGAK